ncbi:MAG: hypothetical protein IJS63_03335 [Bacteroidaceae bacterium]|nr:hypothetical protein [Bacteroidaceae bacterium]
MKKFHFIAIFAILAFSVHAKTTYIPTYFNRIFLIENGQIDSLQNHQQLLQMDSKDNLITCFVAQQVVSPDLIKAIKQAKRTAGWMAVASGLSTAGTTFSEVQMYRGRPKAGYITGYVEGRDLERNFDAMSADASAQAEELMTLMVDLVVKNNSEKEMLITDMDRGLVWFVLPGQETVLPLAKGEECHFRISSCSPLDENVKYINVSADSNLEKYTVALETDAFWYVPISDKAKLSLGFDSPMDDGYIKIDKETRKMTALTPSEFKAIKN